MASRLLLIAGLTVPVALAPMARVRAQVSLDLHALDQPPPHATAPPASRPAPAHHAPARPASRAPARQQQQARPSTPAPKTPQAPQAPQVAAPAPPLPTNLPPTVALSPIVVQPPSGKQETPPPPPISATAGGGVEPITDGIRVLFTPTRTDLTPETEASIRAYAEHQPVTPGTSYNVTAYAPGQPEDLSTPRRLSLSRALAVRSVLMASGIPSAQIYVRALGPATAGGPADRVDVAALATNGAEAKK